MKKNRTASDQVQSNDSRKELETQIQEYEKRLSLERSRVQIINKSYEDAMDKKEALERNLDAIISNSDSRILGEIIGLYT